MFSRCPQGTPSPHHTAALPGPRHSPGKRGRLGRRSGASALGPPPPPGAASEGGEGGEGEPQIPFLCGKGLRDSPTPAAPIPRQAPGPHLGLRETREW